MKKLIETPEYTITEDVIDDLDTTDCARTLTITTGEEEFTFNFAYGKLINFTRCKK